MSKCTDRTWIKFYFDDWMADQNLAKCSDSTQGRFVRILWLMHHTNPYGYLILDDGRYCRGHVARMLRIEPRAFLATLSELTRNGVLKEDEIGYYSARMVRDQQKHEDATRRGSLGGRPKEVNIDKNKNKNKNKNKSEEDNLFRSVYEFWNSHPELIHHRTLTKKMESSLRARFREGYALEEIKAAIENYAKVITSPSHFFSYKWPFGHFMTRGLDCFVNDADPLKNFLSEKGSSASKYPPWNGMCLNVKDMGEDFTWADSDEDDLRTCLRYHGACPKCLEELERRGVAL